MQARGYPVVAVAARRRSAARTLCGKLGGARATTSAARAVERAELILIAVPDRAIAPVATGLARAAGLRWEARTVLHHSGATGLAPLRTLRQRGAAVGLLHPLQALPDAETAREVLPGSRARVEGTPRALRLARRLARDLELVPLRFRGELGDEDRILYHAAAALASNDVLALLASAVDLLQSIGVGRREATRALAALSRGALLQAERRGLDRALTGPVVRGDVEVVRSHLDALQRRSANEAAVHRLLSRRLLQITDAGASPLSPELRRRLAALLAGRRSRPTV
jgi:predicted short-subunit dehydrogenase-like oxidoreductase (DUF2520 family)